MKRKNVTEFRGDLEQIREEALSGIMIDRATMLAKPRVNARIAVSKDRRQKTRTLLRSMGCIPHKEPQGYVYVRIENMTPAHARDAIERRQKHCAGLIRNSVSIALTEARQQQVIETTEDKESRRLMLEATRDALGDAYEKINREIRKLDGIKKRKKKTGNSNDWEDDRNGGKTH